MERQGKGNPKGRVDLHESTEGIGENRGEEEKGGRGHNSLRRTDGGEGKAG